MRAIRDPETQALQPLVERELASALDELPPDFRLAVILSDVEELSYKEIAEVMGCPIGTVMSRLYRGRKLLQTRLRQHAVEMGIIDANDDRDSERESARDSKVTSPDEGRPPTDINTYRNRRRAV